MFSVEPRYSTARAQNICGIPLHFSRRRCGFGPIKFIATKSFYETLIAA